MTTKSKTLFLLLVLLVFMQVTLAWAADAPNTREIPAQIAKDLHDWRLTANILRPLQVILGVLGTAAALVVTTFTTEIGVRRTKICSFIAALAIGLLTAFDIGAKADSCSRGWRHLTDAVLRYQSEPTFTVEQLIQAHTDGEAMVGDVPFRQRQSNTSNATPTPSDTQ